MYLEQIEDKERQILSLMQSNFGFTHKFPITISNKIPGRLYGLTSYKDKKIEIHLNKKVMQESFSYILESVLAHEYAHALLFYLKQDTNEKKGHSQKWQETCVKLGGKDCQQYVNQQEIILSKMPF